MKLGIIGSGQIVQEFLPKLVKMDGIEVLGMQCTPASMEKAENLCRLNGVPRTVADFDALCRLGIDTAYIAVPNSLHFTYCKQALERGFNVIVEKPMVSNVEEALCLKRLGEEKGCFLFEAITTLYLENYHRIREWLPRIGTVKLVQSQFSQYSRRYDAFRKGQVLPVFDPEKAGGALMDLGLYNLHFIMGLFGKPLQVQYFANMERGIDTSGILTMQYPDFYAACVMAKDSRGVAGAVIQGTEGCIKAIKSPNMVGKVMLELNDGTAEEYDEGMEQERMVPEFHQFIRAINEKDRAFCYEMLEKSIAVCEVQTKARLSAGIHFPDDH